MTDAKTSRARLARLEHEFAADIAAVALLLDLPTAKRDAEQLGRSWRAACVSHSALRTLVRDIWRETATRRTPASGDRAALHDLHIAAKDVRSRLRDWARYARIVERQITPAPAPLFQEVGEPGTHLDIMGHVSRLFFDALHAVANPAARTQSDKAHEAMHYRDIPLPMVQFLDLIGAAYRVCLAQRGTHPLRFLDVGSGGGTKVLAATCCFDICHGLEFEDHTVATGTALLKMLGADQCTLMQGDAMRFDNYGNYDVIYFYRPLKLEALMIDMEARIFSQARRGTILLAPSGLMTPNPEQHGVRSVSGFVYVTGLNEAEVQLLQEEARHIGPCIPGHNPDHVSDCGFWEPLRDVCRRNGYLI